MQPLRRADSPHNYRDELFELIRTRSFGRGKIILASGRESDFYFDLRPTTIHPAGAICVGELICDALEGTNAEFIGGLEAGAIPIATSVAIASHRRGGKLQAFFVRKKLKDHGAKKMIEGLPKGESLKGKKRDIIDNWDFLKNAQNLNPGGRNKPERGRDSDRAEPPPPPREPSGN